MKDQLLLKRLAAMMLAGFVGATSIVGCSSDGGLGKAPETTGDSTTDTNTDTSTDAPSASGNVTFRPLSIFESSQEHHGNEDLPVFYQGDGERPFIDKVFLTPLDATTLQPITTATINDFVIEEGPEGELRTIDPLESFPMIQPVGEIPTFLNTAIVVDISPSTLNALSVSALKAEIKAFITGIRASSNPVIAKQRLTIWAYARTPLEIGDVDGTVIESTEFDSAIYEGGFTNNLDLLNARIDNLDRWHLGAASNRNQAIVEAIGRYEGNGSAGASGVEGQDNAFMFKDINTTEYDNNDLKEESSPDRIQVSSIIFISSSKDTLNVFADSDIKKSLESQSLRVFDTSSTDKSAEKNSPKPMLTVMIGDNTGSVPAALSNNSYTVIDQRGIQSSFNFAQQLVSAQTTSINARIPDRIRHVVRYASPKRQGTHNQIIRSNSSEYNFSLTTELKFETASSLSMPWEYMTANPNDIYTPIEITDSNNTYFTGQVPIASVSRLYPATRWTSTTYSANDYSWTFNNGAVTASADGSIPVTGVGTYRVTNDQVGESASIDVIDSYQPTLSLFDNTPKNISSLASVPRSTYITSDPASLSDAKNIIFYATNNFAPDEVFKYTWSLPTAEIVEGDTGDPSASYDYEIRDFILLISEVGLSKLTAPLTVTATNIHLGTSSSFTITTD